MLTSDPQACNSGAKSNWSIPALIVLGMTLSACTTVKTQSFTAVPNSKVEAAFISNEADFGQYDRLLADEMGIFFPQDTYTPAEDLQRLRQIFRSAFLDELEGYTIVDSAGPSTMKVQATLIDLRNSSDATLMGLRKELRDIASRGELLFLMEMRDSKSDAVLARAADSALTPTFATSASSTTDWPSVEDAARHWASLFRQFLDQNLGN
jgi:hypothetical protein